MGEGKSLIEKIFGFGKKEEKKEPPKKEAPKRPFNEFAEDEKTFDGVVRQLKSDLQKDTIIGPHKDKTKK